MADDDDKPDPVQELGDLHAKAMAAHEEAGKHLSAFDKQWQSLSPEDRSQIAVGSEMQSKFLRESGQMKSPDKEKPKKKRAPIYDDSMKY